MATEDRLGQLNTLIRCICLCLYCFPVKINIMQLHCEFKALKNGYASKISIKHSDKTLGQKKESLFSSFLFESRIGRT